MHINQLGSGRYAFVRRRSRIAVCVDLQINRRFGRSGISSAMCSSLTDIATKNALPQGIGPS